MNGEGLPDSPDSFAKGNAFLNLPQLRGLLFSYRCLFNLQSRRSTANEQGKVRRK